MCRPLLLLPGWPLPHPSLTPPANQRWLVSSEGAFSYLARDYALQELYLWPINADQQGTPQQVLLDPRSERCRQFVMAQDNRG